MDMLNAGKYYSSLRLSIFLNDCEDTLYRIQLEMTQLAGTAEYTDCISADR